MAKLHYRDSPSDKEKRSIGKMLAEDEELILVTSYGSNYLRQLFVIGLVWPGVVLFGIGVGLAYFLGNDPWSFGLILGGVLVLLGSIYRSFHAFHAHKYILTTRRVMIKKGVLAVKLTTALFDKITHIEVNQGFIDKLLMHQGTIVIHTAGSEKDEIVLEYIDYPIEFKNLMERLINREREHFGGRGAVMTVEGEVVG